MKEIWSYRCHILMTLAYKVPFLDKLDNYTWFDAIYNNSSNLKYDIFLYDYGHNLKLFKHPRVIIILPNKKLNLLVKIKNKKLVYNKWFKYDREVKRCISFIEENKNLILRYWYRDMRDENSPFYDDASIEEFISKVYIDKVPRKEASIEVFGRDDL